jgi:hypothetical protein
MPLLNSLKRWGLWGLVILLVVAGGWIYWGMHIKFAVLERRFNQLHHSPIVTPKTIASLAWQESAYDALVAQIQGLDRRLAGLQQKVTLLGKQLASGAMRQGTVSVSSGPSHRTSDQIENSNRPPEELFQQPQSPSVADLSDELWDRYSRETRADKWAFDVEAAIQSTFNNLPELANVRIGELNCRTTMCRLTWEFAEGLSSEEKFILENELVAALGAAGLTQGTQIGSGNEIEGYFFPNDTTTAPMQMSD